MVEGLCINCRTTSTPMWRAGPAGPKSLCNACGLRWKKGVLKLDESGDRNSVSSTESSRRKEAAAKAKKSGIPSTKVATGRVAKKVRTSSSERVYSRIPAEVKPKKVYVDFDRYECIFAGLMVVNKFKHQMV
uniref:GATA-type domain-containing protein n=1 Tax=Rhodosorus marinus TaxID=101924 RepID=A0A7S3EJE3_9RHOD|mmetsp:Transcript_38499/g.151900  ORF Transcript_38499/g.151900 Transcript_38499/m.151900 type:complete len:132 (+) Transcript_38499:138-533(+)